MLNVLVTPCENRKVLKLAVNKCITGGVIPVILINGDDNLTEWCKQENIPHFPGVGYVLTLITDFLMRHKRTHIGLLMKSRLPSPAELAFTGALSEASKLDYLSNCITEVVKGREIEYLSQNALIWLNNKITGQDRDHPTDYLRKHIKDFMGDGMKVCEYHDEQLKFYQPPVRVGNHE